MFEMRKQRVLLGRMILDKESPIFLSVELPLSEIVKKSAALKDRLAFLLDTRFHPADPESSESPGLTVEQVAERLHCRSITILRMVRRGKLHPFTEGDTSELYFDPAEVANIKAVPLRSVLSRLIPRI
jgi:hypothetical protein